MYTASHHYQIPDLMVQGLSQQQQPGRFRCSNTVYVALDLSKIGDLLTYFSIEVIGAVSNPPLPLDTASSSPTC